MPISLNKKLSYFQSILFMRLP